MPIAYRLVAALTMALTAASCSSPILSLGSALAESVLPTGSGERGQLVAEVVEVDEVQRRIRVTTDDGRTGTVLYDANTVVVREQQHVTVKALESGELVVIQVENADGQLYAARIDVQNGPADAEPDPDSPADPDPDPDQDPEADPS